MGRRSKVQKQVEETIQSTPKRPRKKREVKLPPPPFKLGSPVKITSPDDFKGIKFGIIRNICKDGGINVYLVNPKVKGVAEYVCIHSDRGQSIELLNG